MPHIGTPPSDLLDWKGCHNCQKVVIVMTLQWSLWQPKGSHFATFWQCLFQQLMIKLHDDMSTWYQIRVVKVATFWLSTVTTIPMTTIKLSLWQHFWQLSDNLAFCVILICGPFRGMGSEAYVWAFWGLSRRPGAYFSSIQGAQKLVFAGDPSSLAYDIKIKIQDWSL